MLYLKTMDENIKPLLIYLPVLHPELVSDPLPNSLLDEVFFIDPGLGKTAPEYKFYTSPGLVYSPKEARACLFAGLFFAAVWLVPRAGLWGIARYDLLLLIALAIQGGMLAARLETLDEMKAINDLISRARNSTR